MFTVGPPLRSKFVEVDSSCTGNPWRSKASTTATPKDPKERVQPPMSLERGGKMRASEGGMTNEAYKGGSFATCLTNNVKKAVESFSTPKEDAGGKLDDSG